MITCDWSIEVMIAYKDHTIEEYTERWPKLAMDDVDEKCTRFVEEQIAKRRVHGVSMSATAQVKGTLSKIVRMQWK